MAADTAVWPTRKGIFLISKATSLKAQGGYLINGETATKLSASYPSAAAVSPDGCRVAYIAAERDRAPYTVSMIDLCAGDGHGN